ncbi:MAG: alpha/beta hydrolase [Deltaproteobacteria bacterium]|nr:alpha/beta hydrolase [Deltaproteobacteria bacterium]
MAAIALAYREWGNRSLPAVLLVHGLAGCGRIWEPLAEGLADLVHVVAPDLRGHGGSPCPGTYTAEAYLEDLEALVAELGVNSLALVGHSFGGLLCAGYAVRHPERTRALVSIDINIPPPAWQTEHLREAGSKPHPVFATRGEAEAYLRKNLAPASSNQVMNALAEALLARVTNGTTGFTLNFDRETLCQAAPLEVAGQLDRLTCPTLFLRGSESAVMDRAAAIALLSRLPHSRLVQIPRAGHHVFLDNPAATVQEVRRFLTETQRAR